MTLGLTNKDIIPVRGNAALLPNQPILQGCVVDGTTEGVLVPGDIVALSTEANKPNLIVVKKAAVTDEPFGVVVGNPIKTGFAAGEKVSVFPDNSYYYALAGAASIARGSVLQFNAAGDVLATATSGNGVIGVACTEGVLVGDPVIVKIKTGKA